MKKETSFHWFKEDEEIVPEDPPNVLSGACALPLPLVTMGTIQVYTQYRLKNRKFPMQRSFPQFSRKDHGVYKAVLGDDRGKDTSTFDISGQGTVSQDPSSLSVYQQ